MKQLLARRLQVTKRAACFNNRSPESKGHNRALRSMVSKGYLRLLGAKSSSRERGKLTAKRNSTIGVAMHDGQPMS